MDGVKTTRDFTHLRATAIEGYRECENFPLPDRARGACDSIGCQKVNSSEFVFVSPATPIRDPSGDSFDLGSRVQRLSHLSVPLTFVYQVSEYVCIVHSIGSFCVLCTEAARVCARPSRVERRRTSMISLPRLVSMTVVALFLVACGGGTTPSSNSKPIRFGVPEILSGTAQAVGGQGLQGVQMAVDEINAAGGVNGSKIELGVQEKGLHGGA